MGSECSVHMLTPIETSFHNPQSFVWPFLSLSLSLTHSLNRWMVFPSIYLSLVLIVFVFVSTFLAKTFDLLRLLSIEMHFHCRLSISVSPLSISHSYSYSKWIFLSSKHKL